MPWRVRQASHRARIVIVKKTPRVGRNGRPQARPKNLALWTIRLPINAMVSILHRASGVALFVAMPVLLWWLYASLRSAESYQAATGWLQSIPVKLLLSGLLWAFLHHFYAGLRHLAMDVHWMTSLQKARFSSRVVLLLVGLSLLGLLPAIW